ncbi:hypothetical protein DFP93_104246 [Aneurinibacillus soli]|uniref:Uncharacterized protein n=1 Tax=Aneurinibacillus soli TaxID=1500254 RepID=A0A0U5C5K6_9BACL|nr:hypothetical protein DFP93_104246 [Aneurinibacillus soli]BAU27155.1 hypothetical protein CB4_01324 [Aneurinibacillus soli]
MKPGNRHDVQGAKSSKAAALEDESGDTYLSMQPSSSTTEKRFLFWYITSPSVKKNYLHLLFQGGYDNGTRTRTEI